MLIKTPELVLIFAYSILFGILILPQINENYQEYKQRLIIVLCGIIPAMVSVASVFCLSQSCPSLAVTIAYINTIWCICIIYIYLFKKLI